MMVGSLLSSSTVMVVGGGGGGKTIPRGTRGTPTRSELRFGPRSRYHYPLAPQWRVPLALATGRWPDSPVWR